MSAGLTGVGAGRLPAPGAVSQLSPRVSLRTCVGCKAVRPVGELVRIGLNGEGFAEVDERRRLPGRGAHLCRATTLDCLSTARRRRALARALRTDADRIDHHVLSAALAAGPS